MKPASEEIRGEFIQLWSRLSRAWGISRAAARIYAWLFSRPNGADVDEILAGLSIGRGTVSTACRELREWSLILSDQLPGSRRTRYRVETDLSRVIRSIITHRKAREWDPIVEHAQEWIPRLEDDRSPEAGIFRERLRALAGCMSLADEVIARFLAGHPAGDVAMQDLTAPRRSRQPDCTPRAPDTQPRT